MTDGPAKRIVIEGVAYIREDLVENFLLAGTTLAGKQGELKPLVDAYDEAEEALWEQVCKE